MSALGWLLDVTPWWVWAMGAAALLAATWQLWAPLAVLVPRPVKIAAGALLAVTLAYLAGRNRGAAGALQQAKEREAAHADKITDAARRARARADALNVGDRLRDDDGWRRD